MTVTPLYGPGPVAHGSSIPSAWHLSQAGTAAGEFLPRPWLCLDNTYRTYCAGPSGRMRFGGSIVLSGHDGSVAPYAA